MKIIYGIPDRFGKYDLETSVSESNPGGGISTKAQRVYEAWNEWYDDVEMVEKWWELTQYPASYLVIDPLSFVFAPNVEAVIEVYEQHPAHFKILYGSELSILEIPYDLRQRIVDASTFVTTCCKFQEDIFHAINIKSTRFADPVPENVFYNPKHKKELSVVACGSISDCKQSYKTIEIFKALEGKMKRIYVGGADLWGDTSQENLRLESEMRHVVEEFYYNVPQSKVAKIFAQAACGIFDTAHETYSESNAEFLMAGGRAYYGLHQLWRERPGVYGLTDPLSFVNAISSETQEFKQVPADEKREASETWALKNCSYTAFMAQWKEIIRQCQMISSTNSVQPHT
ncbi:MAG: hypothetical protein OXM61_10700 [Candidatus Poribacteria bacterium]|nr:hypothetical protein [Candidatus Poribacteria bacterium]